MLHPAGRRKNPDETPLRYKGGPPIGFKSIARELVGSLIDAEYRGLSSISDSSIRSANSMRTALYIIGWFQSGIVADDVVGLQSGSPRDLPFDAWQIRLGILFFVFVL